MSGLIQHQNDQQVATVTLNRPDLHNAFNDEMIAELTGVFQKLSAQTDVRAIVLASVGKSFSAGADLNWMKRMVDYSFDENVQDAMALSRLLQTIHDCPKPVIARVHGAAFGGGVGLISACDMAVALESAVFSLSEVKLGLLPAVISPFVMEKIGPGHAHRYFLTAERFSAQEAHRIGLISDVAATEAELDEWIQRITEQIKANGPEAVAACKRLIADLQRDTGDSRYEMTARYIAERRSAAEGQEGMKAFLEKRSPQWLTPVGG
jgi:methylglutaconyl-CoA hydratase